MDQVAALTGTNRILMTGAVRVFVKPDNRLGATNSFYIFGPGGVLLSTYDKFHLVPFGEYLPLAGLLERLGHFASRRGSGRFRNPATVRTLTMFRVRPRSAR